ncbi:MAG: hypothetical protein OXB84_08660, partial [Halobacteriovoraceae bacterium]|nr:hypothetical protein [Halobacteriovoraceae bacterium]
MDIGDYSSRLQAARNDFRNQVSRLRKTHKHRLEDLNDIHKDRQVEQKKNYQNSLNKISQKVKENMDRQNERNKVGQDKRKRFFVEHLENQKNQSVEDQKNFRKRYNKKLMDLKDAYYSSTQEKEQMRKKDKENMEKVFDTRFKKTTDELEDQLKELNRNATKKVVEFNKESLEDRRDLTTRYRKDLASIEKTNITARNEDKEKYDSNLDQLRKGYKEHLNRLKHMQEDLERRIFEKRKDDVKDKISSEERFRKTVAEKNAAEKERLKLISKRNNIEHQKKLREIEGLNRKTKVDPYRLHTDVIDEIHINSIKDRSEKRVKGLINQMKDKNLEYNDERGKLLDGFKKSRLERNQEYARKLDEMRKETYEIHAQNLNDDEDVVNSYRDQLDRNNKEHELHMDRSKRAAQREIKEARKKGLDRKST